MKILICSTLLSETRGGVALVTRLLAEGFVLQGHEVQIATRCPDREWSLQGIKVYRHPSPWRMVKTVRWADVVILQGLCLRLAWSTALIRKPILLVYHITPMKQKGMHSVLSGIIERKARCYAVSHFMAQALGCDPISNPYDDRLFGAVACSQKRDRDIVFVGRLVPEKGITVLFRAIEKIYESGLRPSITIIGDKVEGKGYVDQAVSASWGRNIVFRGHLSQSEVAKELCRHKILVVPSLCDEAFGIVALEGIASGCAVIASRIGGLPEAVGDHGVLFDAGNETQLAESIQSLLRHRELRLNLLNRSEAHLRQHTRESVVNQYLQEIKKMIGKNP